MVSNSNDQVNKNTGEGMRESDNAIEIPKRKDSQEVAHPTGTVGQIMQNQLIKSDTELNLSWDK